MSFHGSATGLRTAPHVQRRVRPSIPVLAQHHAVHAYDLLGYGDSERREDHDVSIAVQGRLLAELVRTWGLDRPALVGHDIGGATVLRSHLLEGVAARRLALVDAVVLGPWVTPASRHIKAHLEAYRTMPAHLFREVAAAHLRTATYRPMDEDVFAAIFGQWEGEQGQALWLAHGRGLRRAAYGRVLAAAQHDGADRATASPSGPSPPPRCRAPIDGRPAR